MPRAIDHLVIAVPDPDEAARQLEGALGITATGGGEHPGVGTWNRLAFVGEAYLELIGVRDAAAATRWPVGAATLRSLASGGGLATFALVDDDLDSTVAGLRDAGSGIGPVTPGSRTRPDGETVQWWTATLDNLALDAPPFLIRHDYHGAEWGEEAMLQRRAFVHPLGTPVSLIGMDLATDDPPRLAARYEREVGIRFDMDMEDALTIIGPHRVRLRPSSATPPPAIVHLRGGSTASAVDVLRIRFELTPA